MKPLSEFLSYKNILYLFGLFLCLLFASCSSKIYPDRSYFLKDGDEIPTVNLSNYRSVQERPNQEPDLAVAMAISGGGSRAACLGIGIMLGLEQIQMDDGQDALDQIDYLSTVSGGGFAGGAYIAALYDHRYFQRDNPFLLRAYVPRQIRKDLSHSYTGTLVKANFNPKLWVSLVDDGDALEKAIDDHVLGYKRRRGGKNRGSILLGDLFVPLDSAKEKVRYPMHFTNSSTINTMHIFPFTPHLLQTYKVNGYTHRLRIIEEDAINVFEVPLAVGIKSSGSFPALISNTTLRSDFNEERQFLHLFDGAMTDNTGYYTALDVLEQDNAPRKVLFVVDADALGNIYTFSKREKAYSMLKVVGRLPSSGLDARRATLLDDLETACKQLDVLPIYFSFNAFLQNNPVDPPEVIDLKVEQKRLILLMETKKEILSPEDQQILYELLTNIGTKYTIKAEEQKLLFLAGQQLVMMQQEAILEAMK